MDRFLFTYQSPGLSEQDETGLKAAQKRFCRGQNLLHKRGKSFQLFFESFNDNYTFEIREESGFFFCGRDIHKSSAYPIDTENFVNFNFPYLFLKFGYEKGKVTVKTDPYGLFSYFYASCDGQLVITNYFPAVLHFLNVKAEIDPLALDELLIYGNLSPGRTLFNKIKMGHPLHNLEIQDFSVVSSQKKSKPQNLRISDEKDSSLFYEVLKESVEHLLKTTDIYWITLTGGADSRLIFSTLDQKSHQLRKYLFDNVAADPHAIPYDSKIVEMIKEHFSLKIDYGFPQRVIEENKSYVGSQKNSVHNHILTGLYGGEILGGQALKVQPRILGNKMVSHRGFEFARDRQKIEFQEHISSQSDLFYNLTLMISSFMSFFYEDKNWLFPFAISQKKITPFLNSKILEIVFSQKEEDLTQFSFYQKIYQNCAPLLINFPFNSAIATFGSADFKNIKDKINRPDGSEQKKDEEILIQRQRMVKDFLSDFKKD